MGQVPHLPPAWPRNGWYQDKGSSTVIEDVPQSDKD